MGLICALFVGCGLVLVWRLYGFQVLDSARYQQLADAERHAEIPIIPIRGALFDTVRAWSGDGGALVATTLLFAAMHVPLYGIGSLPLDLAAGMLLGGLRIVSGGVVAPAMAHVIADLAGGWLV